MSVILQQQTFVAADWGTAVVLNGTATVTQQFSFGVAVTGTLTQGATISVVEQNPSHTVLTLTCTGTGGGGDFLLVDGGGNDYVFSNSALSVGSQSPATTQGFANYQAPARNLVWTGAKDTSFTNAANWNDTSNALSPAASAPGGADTAQFLTAGGTITGNGTAAALQFGGSALWDVTSGASLTAGTGVTVGQGGSGTLLINGGASIVGLGASDTISGISGSAAAVTVDGTGSAWKSTGELIVGNSGSGSLSVTNKASVNAASASGLPAMVLGAAAGGSGALLVAGAGSEATLVGQLDVGQAGGGTVSINNQGTVITGGSTLAPSQGIDVAQASGASGSITVSGTNSLLTNAGQFVVGDSGQGNLTIQGGATVVTTPGTVAGLAGLVVANADSSGGSSINVSGTGSNLQVTGLLDVGVSGSGALSVSNGASVTAGSLDAGNIASAVANISVTDASFTVTGNATVADDGTGVLSVLSGATFAAANLTIGSQGDSSGAVVVSGTNSVVNIAGNLNVGTSLGTGDLTIGPGGVVNAKVVSLQGQVVLENGELDPTVNLINQGQTAGGSGTIAAGDIVDEGVIQAGGSKPSQKLLVVNGTVLGGGPWTINGTAQAQANGGAGILQINAGGTLELNGAVLNAPSTTFTDDVTPQSTYTVTNSVVDVNFADATGVLKLDQIVGFAGTIVAFQKGDSFVITGGTLSGLGLSNGNTLTVSDSGHGGTDSLIFASGVSAAGFSIVNNNTIQVACFAAGTRIGTIGGERPVETLSIGDELPTLRGGTRRVVWVGRRAMDLTRHPKPEAAWPVRIRAGAFARSSPVRDLFLSPDHAIYFDGVLIPVKLLINGSTISQVKQDHVVYHHVELEQHDVILAEGLAAETYLDAGDRDTFSGGHVTALHPEFSARRWEMTSCAPLVLTGTPLDKARRHLAARAALSGHAAIAKAS